MNILILSCGTRNIIVQYFRRAFEGVGSVVTTDCNALAPALYEGDRHYIVPKITDAGYIDVILDICKKEKINGVLSLIDPELSLLAENSERFADAGVTVIGCDYEVCERCFDKYEMYKWLSSHGYSCARTYKSADDFEQDERAGKISFPVFVKTECGSASVGITTAESMEAVRFIERGTEKKIIQEYLNGQEIGVDMYVDLISGETVSIFAKKKLLMRAGETDKSVSFKSAELFELCERLAAECCFRGQIDIDIFEVDGKFYISEVNPRFGGGYPHAHGCGIDSMKLILNNLLEKPNKKDIGSYKDGVYMMKYNEIMIL